MNLQFYIEKLKSSDSFRQFIKEKPEAYLCSGFFVISKEESKKENKSTDEKTHLDFFSPKEKKMFSFDIKEEKLIPLDKFEKTPNEISENVEVDFDEIEKKIFEEMKNKKIDSKIQKLIISLQSKNGKPWIFGTGFLPMLSLIKFEMDLENKTIKDMEKKSLFDMVKVSRKGEK